VQPQKLVHNALTTRHEYTAGELRREDLDADPIEQFSAWFAQACEGSVLEPSAMSLATVSPQGQPSLRTVLLKSYDADGFVFFTNRESRKAREMERNARVSLLFPWIAQERQVIVMGTAEQISKVQTLRYFLTRPRGSQIAAWISPQSSVITSRSLLELQWETMKQKFADGRIPVPPFWGGYRVRPREIEFWQGRANRLHDRFQYLRNEDGTWTIDRLAP